MRSLSVTALLAALFGIAPPAAQPPAPEPDGKLSLTVTAEAAEIQACDPLLFKVTLLNRTREPLVLTGPFCCVTGALGYEIRRAPATAFRTVIDGGPLSVGGYRRVVPPGGAEVSYELAFRMGDAFVFPEPGEWQLRAFARPGGAPLVSPPVAVRVRPRDDRAGGDLRADASRFEVALVTHGSTGQSAGVQLGRLGPRLGDSNLKRWLARNALLEELREAETPAQYDRFLAEVERARGQLPAITREHFDLMLASVHLIRGDRRRAEAIIAAVRENSFILDGLKHRLAP